MIAIDKVFPHIHFLSDEEVFSRAFAEATDEEKQLIKLTAPELAGKYQDAKASGEETKCVLISHYLNLRLVSMQVKATDRASYVSIFGVILGVLLGYAIGKLPNCF
jgi:hypothetical protein